VKSNSHQSTVEQNPYKSPNAAVVPARHPAPSRWHLIFFTINFVAAMAWVIMCVIVVVEVSIGDGSPFALAGAICSIGPAFAFALAEWLFFTRRFDSLRRPLGFGCGAVAAFMAFGFFANVFEAFTFRRRPDAPANPPGIMFWLIFGSISVAIASYGFYCCWFRLRDRPRHPSRDSGDRI